MLKFVQIHLPKQQLMGLIYASFLVRSSSRTAGANPGQIGSVSWQFETVDDMQHHITMMFKLCFHSEASQEERTASKISTSSSRKPKSDVERCDHAWIICDVCSMTYKKK